MERVEALQQEIARLEEESQVRAAAWCLRSELALCLLASRRLHTTPASARPALSFGKRLLPLRSHSLPLLAPRVASPAAAGGLRPQGGASQAAQRHRGLF